MFCEKCGSELKEGQQFCPKCGTRINLQSGEKGKKKLPVIIGASAGGVVVLSGLIVLAILVIIPNIKASYYSEKKDFTSELDVETDTSDVEAKESEDIIDDSVSEEPVDTRPEEYAAAMKLFEDGDYLSAYDAFLALDGYESSVSYLTDIEEIYRKRLENDIENEGGLLSLVQSLIPFETLPTDYVSEINRLCDGDIDIFMKKEFGYEFYTLSDWGVQSGEYLRPSDIGYKGPDGVWNGDEDDWFGVIPASSLTDIYYSISGKFVDFNEYDATDYISGGDKGCMMLADIYCTESGEKYYIRDYSYGGPGGYWFFLDNVSISGSEGLSWQLSGDIVCHNYEYSFIDSNITFEVIPNSDSIYDGFRVQAISSLNDVKSKWVEKYREFLNNSGAVSAVLINLETDDDVCIPACVYSDGYGNFRACQYADGNIISEAGISGTKLGYASNTYPGFRLEWEEIYNETVIYHIEFYNLDDDLCFTHIAEKDLKYYYISHTLNLIDGDKTTVVDDGKWYYEDVNGEITEEQFNNLKGYYDEYCLSTDYNQMLDWL